MKRQGQQDMLLERSWTSFGGPRPLQHRYLSDHLFEMFPDMILVVTLTVVLVIVSKKYTILH